MQLLPLLAIAIAHVPLVIVYFQQLWDRPHYQFFPLVLGAFAYFTWQRLPDRRPPHPKAVWLSRLILPVAAVLLTFAFLRLSPLFAYASLVLVIGAMLLRVGVPALGPWLLLWLVIRIPYGQDIALIQWMQRLTTDLSSTALDTIGIEHISDGNVLRFPTNQLFVEEACSGVVSLLAIVACGGILAVWWRRSIVHSLLLVASGIFWAGAMNVVRVSTIAVALDRFGIDLTAGWRHEAVGLVVFAVSLLALFSTDRLIFFLLSPIRTNALSSYWDHAEGNVLVALWNQYIGLEEPVDEMYEKEPTQAPAPPTVTAVGLKAGGLAWDWITAALFLVVGGGQVMAGIGPFSVAPDISPIAMNLSEQSLPDELGAWRRVGFNIEERDSSSAFGQNSRIWAYRKGPLVVNLSLDFVFPEWHELTACYSGVGWTAVSRSEQEAVTGPPFIQATFNKPNGESALLIFDLFDDAGRPYETPSGSFMHPQLRRIFGGESNRWTLPNYYQTQALTILDVGALPPEARRDIRELFARFRQEIVAQLTSPTGPASRFGDEGDNAKNNTDDRTTETLSPKTTQSPSTRETQRTVEVSDAATIQ